VISPSEVTAILSRIIGPTRVTSSLGCDFEEIAIERALLKTKC